MTPPSHPIHRDGHADWLWRRMARHLDRVAIDGVDRTWTFRELLEDADRVARRLDQETTPGHAALLLAPRAVPGTVVLLLALWRSGRTAVLGDAGMPGRRVDDLVRALPPSAVLQPSDKREDGGERTLEAGALHWQIDRREGSTRFPYGCRDPAYVISTSGSTGTPKLVLCHHAGLEALTESLTDRYGYGPDSRVLQFAPASYDAMIADVVVPLAAGSALVFGALDEPPSPAQVCELVSKRRITHLTLPPTALRHLHELDAPLCTIISAGEALDGTLARTLLERCGRLINAYGPCEATVAATAFDVTYDDLAETIPIGTPIPGVDVRLDPLPDDSRVSPARGVISIGGRTVAWGYVVADGLTEPTVPGFSPVRRFVTGDIAWRDAGGNLVFAGRIDRQFKRWGHRVEPGAIERRLREILGVTDVAVVAEASRLHAFVVTREPQAAIETTAAELLPRHEQPTDWHLVDRMPSLASDKLNFAELTAAAADAPVDGIDPRLAALWERYIGPAERPEADLFAAGGDSMGGVLLLSAIEEELGVSLSLTEFLESPTLGTLNERITS